jgi:hypothetical protein
MQEKLRSNLKYKALGSDPFSNSCINQLPCQEWHKNICMAKSTRHLMPGITNIPTTWEQNELKIHSRKHKQETHTVFSSLFKMVGHEKCSTLDYNSTQ